MRLGMLADTHDELARTHVAVRVLRENGAEALVHCGDLASPPIVAACAPLPFWFVLGNHDSDWVPTLQHAAIESTKVAKLRAGYLAPGKANNRQCLWVRPTIIDVGEKQETSSSRLAMACGKDWLSAALSLSVALAGCTSAPEPFCDCHPAVPGRSPEVLPVCYRPGLEGRANVSEIVRAYADTLRKPHILPLYRQLGVRPCQCLAVQAAPLANLLDRETQLALQKAPTRKHGGHKARQAAIFKAQMLTYLAQEDRNRSAGQALDAYYNLGEAEAGADVLQASLSQILASLVKARALKAKGLPADDASLYRQQLDLQARAARLQIQIQQLNSQLRTLLGFEPCSPAWQISPADAFQVVADRLDADQAVAVGLAHRPELLLLRLLEEELCAGDLDSVRQQLRAINAVLSQDQPPHCPKLQQFVAKLCASADAEQDVRRQEVSEYRAARERAVSEEIRQAVQTAQGQINVVVFTLQRAESWHGTVQEAEEKEAKGADGFAQTTEAKVEWYKARRDVISEIIRLQRAKVQIRRAQGVLPEECSLAATPSGEPLVSGGCPAQGAPLAESH